MNDNDFSAIAIGKLLNIGGMLQRKANQLFLPFDLNQQQFSILFEIYRAGKVSQKEMVNRMVLEKAHVSKVVKKLSSMELVDITVSAEDKRSSWLSITQKGTDTVKSCQKIIQTWNSDWVVNIKPEERRAILDNLTVLQDVLKECIQGT